MADRTTPRRKYTVVFGWTYCGDERWWVVSPNRRRMAECFSFSSASRIAHLLNQQALSGSAVTEDAA